MAISDYTPKDLERFWSKINKNGSVPSHCPELGACWEWLGCKSEKLYGAVTINKKGYRVHRLAWILANDEIPDGLWVLHKCDNPSCCNPNHLFLGTAKDNYQDMIDKGRSGKFNQKLTQDEIFSIRSRYGTYINPYHRISYSYLAKEYNVTPTTIMAIVKRKTWNSL